MDYITDFGDMTIRQSDLNSLICSLNMDRMHFKRIGEYEKADGIKSAMNQVEHLIATLRGMDASRKIREMCVPIDVKDSR